MFLINYSTMKPHVTADSYELWAMIGQCQQDECCLESMSVIV